MSQGSGADAPTAGAGTRTRLRAHLAKLRALLLMPEEQHVPGRNGLRFAVAEGLREIGAPRQAEALYAAILHEEPDNARAQAFRAACAVDAGRVGILKADSLEQSLDRLADLFGVTRQDQAYIRQKAATLTRMGFPAEAQALLRGLARTFSGPRPEMRGLSQQMVAMGETGAAAILLDRMLEPDPDDTTVLAWRAELALQEADPALALSLCARGLARNDGHEDLRRVRAEALARQGHADRAAEELAALVAQSPANPRARLSLADTLVAAGRLAEAEAACHAVLAAMPAQPRALMILIGVAQAEGDIDEALLRCRAALEQCPGDPRFLSRLAQICAQAGREGEGLAILEPLRREAPPGSPLHRMTAEALSAAGRVEEAEAIYRQMLAQDPADLAALTGLATLAEQRGAFDAALAHLEEALWTPA
ncbi:tetratricopeptide repeat protein [Mangrovicoccus algicola]|uniref:Tetratricopeptide repeat protein n=1 Tax=Mangrovicoccus algicola TaxID=2771008 RepID=A0A8J6YU34_9RHOB|nr:tetratricopeptide repeat protein [Mangrovicoccus algicola]MBE3637567.1 tetratricopeptide repeat protein [Mangrovicoccus algicola]